MKAELGKVCSQTPEKMSLEDMLSGES